MSGRKLVTGALVAFVVAFLLSGLWHVVLMGDYYESVTVGGREAPLMWVIGLAYLVVGLIMAYMYPKGYEGGSPPWGRPEVRGGHRAPVVVPDEHRVLRNP